MTKNDESPSFTIPTMDELLKLISALNPAENGAKVVDQAKRSVESVMASLQLILQSLPMPALSYPTSQTNWHR
jgi:hypothetical protein